MVSRAHLCESGGSFLKASTASNWCTITSGVYTGAFTIRVTINMQCIIFFDLFFITSCPLHSGGMWHQLRAMASSIAAASFSSSSIAAASRLPSRRRAGSVDAGLGAGAVPGRSFKARALHTHQHSLAGRSARTLTDPLGTERACTIKTGRAHGKGIAPAPGLRRRIGYRSSSRVRAVRGHRGRNLQRDVAPPSAPPSQAAVIAVKHAVSAERA